MTRTKSIRNIILNEERHGSFSYGKKKWPLQKSWILKIPNIPFGRRQGDQIGQFFKVLGNKFTPKSSPKRLLTFGQLRKRSINVKTGLDIIEAKFENIWVTF